MQLLYYYLYPDPLFHCGTNLLLLELNEGTSACLPPPSQRSLPPAHSRQGSAVLALAQCSELLKTAAAVPCFCSLALCCGLFSSGEQQEQNEREWCDTASFTKKEILRKMSWFLESTQNTETDKLTPSTRHEELCRNKLNTQNS